MRHALRFSFFDVCRLLPPMLRHGRRLRHAFVDAHAAFFFATPRR